MKVPCAPLRKSWDASMLLAYYCSLTSHSRSNILYIFNFMEFYNHPRNFQTFFLFFWFSVCCKKLRKIIQAVVRRMKTLYCFLFLYILEEKWILLSASLSLIVIVGTIKHYSPVNVLYRNSKN